jgi:hypothetical protein
MVIAPGAARMENDVMLPVVAGIVLSVLIVAGSVVVLMRPSDLPKRSKEP